MKAVEVVEGRWNQKKKVGKGVQARHRSGRRASERERRITHSEYNDGTGSHGFR